jgi:pimeloyl-ACP methyl ester carboxylesterase
MVKGISATGIAFEVAGESAVGSLPAVLVHAGVADRRMWDVVWAGLIVDRPVLRLDLRGYGDSTARPIGPIVPYADVLATMDAVGIERAHVVGASYGGGVALEVALVAPERVASLFLLAPGGSLIEHPSPWLSAAWRAEVDALEEGDLDAAVEVNLRAWVDGPAREPGEVDPEVRSRVAVMQRRAFEVSGDWDDVEEDELDPPALARLGDLAAPTLLLVGEGDGDVLIEVAEQVAEEVPDAQLIRWPTVAHLPSMERPTEFLALAREWFATNDDG